MTVGGKVKQTLSSLQGAASILHLYGEQNQKEQVRAEFKEATQVIEEVILNLEERVKQLEFEEPQYKGY